jgi:S-DNA-T family DNA segregation ATPase FtsK/SpoIIIE
LWVGDQDLSKGKVTWSLTRAGKADLFGTIPFGADQRGRPIAIPLIFNSMLIAAMPRQGKTFALRVLLLGCALDPTVELRIFELKGTGDLEPLAKVAHRYASGAADDATLSACMDSLREVYAELERRADAIKKLPKTVVPENKVTRELANRRKAGLHPIVLPIDECQELFTHPDFKEEAEKLCVGIMKRGPALGIMLILATQRPDKDSLPKSISANAGLRFCLRVMGQVENDMVLGTSMYKVGVRATQFTPEDLGIGWLVGATKYPRIVKAAFVDNPGADKIADRARAAKVAAGWLTGHAAGEVETGPSHNVVDDLLMVFGDEDKAHNEVLVSRLAQAWPDRYTGWTPADLTRALKPYGVPVGQTWGAPVDGGKPTNRQGINRADLIAARR